MVSIEQYRKICTDWKGNAAEFSWLVRHGDIIGVSQRALADEFEFAPSTVSRWAGGDALPHRRIQQLVIADLEKKARRLEQAAVNAVALAPATSGIDESLDTGSDAGEPPGVGS